MRGLLHGARLRRLPMTVRRFLGDTHGAAGIAAVAVTVMTLGAAALITDHAWLIDQRDVMKTATDAAGIAATLEMTRRAGQSLDEDALKAELTPVARRYILLNLKHLPTERYRRANDTLQVALKLDRKQNTVQVDAEADLGGPLMFGRVLRFGTKEERDSMDWTMHAQAGIVCASSIIEVVLALDVTRSMDNKDLDGDGHRMQTAIDAAKALVNVLLTGCDGADVVIGVVPWDKTVRLPSPAQWARNGWVKTNAFTGQRAHPGYEDWAGCVMDREHDSVHPKDSDGLSLTPPGQAPFRAFLYPDTNRLDPQLIGAIRDKILLAFAGQQIANTLPPERIEQMLRARSDNPWGGKVFPSTPGTSGATGGPNNHCTRVAMLPLSSDRGKVEAVLDSLYDPNQGLLRGATLAHLGVTWGRRMLAASWRDVWGDAVHPVDPSEHSSKHVTKTLILLSDGQNAAVDPRRTGGSSCPPKTDDLLPGKLEVSFASGDSELGFGCNKNDETVSSTYASHFTAMGRFGAGREEDGHLPDQHLGGIDRKQDARERLNDLMAASCELAHDEGVDIYTISLYPPHNSVSTDWKDKLVACSGKAGMTTDEREAYHLEGTDSVSLEKAFRTIGERLIKVRRTS